MGPHGIPNAEMYYLGTPKNAVTDHAGVVDHIAFVASEPGGFIRRFKERGIDFQPRSLPEFDLYQIFIKDPNGLTIELNFFGLKDVTDWGGEDYSKMPQAAMPAGGRDARVTVAQLHRGHLRRGDAPGRAPSCPTLRERAGGAEAARQMEKETLDDLHRAGLFRFHQPKRWGGMELPFVAMFDVPAEIARGCASTGWNVANLGIHHWMLALYDERAQEEIWGQDPDALIASGIAYPAGAAAAAWTAASSISGFWNFSSGVDPATWNMLAVTVRDGDRVVDHRMCLVPRGEYEIVDDWQVLGMRSTGSKSVRAKDVFVPEHRALCMYLASAAATASRARAATPIRCYRVPLAALGSHCLAGGRRRQRAGRARAHRSRRSRSAAPTTPRCACATSRPCSCAWPAPAPRSTRPG